MSVFKPDPEKIREALDRIEERKQHFLKYELKGMEIGHMVAQKQQAYGDSWGKTADILRILYPDGIRPEQYDDAAKIVRVLDKIARISAGNYGEENAWLDLAGYGILGAVDGDEEEEEAADDGATGNVRSNRFTGKGKS